MNHSGDLLCVEEAQVKVSCMQQSCIVGQDRDLGFNVSIIIHSYNAVEEMADLHHPAERSLVSGLCR